MFLFSSMPIAEFARAPKGTVAIYEVKPADANKAQGRLVSYTTRTNAGMTSERIWGINSKGETTRFIRAKITKAGAARKKRGPKA